MQCFWTTFQLRASTSMFFHTALSSVPSRALRMQHFIRESSAYSSGIFFPSHWHPFCEIQRWSFLNLKEDIKMFSDCIRHLYPFSKWSLSGFLEWGVAAWYRQCEPPPKSHLANSGFNMPSIIRSMPISKVSKVKIMNQWNVEFVTAGIHILSAFTFDNVYPKKSFVTCILLTQ